MDNNELIKKRKSTVIALLRKGSRWWPAKAEAKKLAKVSPGMYKCSSCSGVYGDKEINVDHIKPVIPVKEGFKTWDEFVNNLFCNTDNLAILCIPCHDLKSMVEREQRKKYRALRKKATKK